jgi:hypothetical protein
VKKEQKAADEAEKVTKRLKRREEKDGRHEARVERRKRRAAERDRAKTKRGQQKDPDATEITFPYFPSSTFRHTFSPETDWSSNVIT